jgi:hypothetical protein
MTRGSARWVFALAVATAGLMLGGVAYARVCERVVPVLDAQEPPSLLIVMDASKSMSKPTGDGATRLQAAKAALRALVKDLPDGSRVGLRLYGHRVAGATRAEGCRDTELVAPVGELDRAGLLARIDSYEAVGFTPIGRALRAAAADLPTGGAASIVLVSDGGDNCAPPSPCAVAEQIAAGGQDVSVQAVGFRVNDRARAQLRCIAKRGGGAYRDASDARELAVVLRALAARATRVAKPVGRPVAGGSSAADARPVASGRFRDEIGPGEERWYRVGVEPGQRLAAAATLMTPCPLGSGSGVRGASLTLAVLEAEDGLPDAYDGRANLFLTDASVESVGVLTAPLGASDAPPAAAAGNGSRLLQVRLTGETGGETSQAHDGGRIALQLEVNVLGRPRAGPADPAADRVDDEGAGPGAGALAGAVLGAVLIGAVAGAAAGARRARGGS